MKDLGWRSAKGRQIRIGRTTADVIGVVQDFHFQSLAHEITPVIFVYGSPESSRQNYISVAVHSQNMASTLSFLQAKWRILDPSRPFDYFFIDDHFGKLYENENRLLSVTGTFTIFSILISSIGLFALASLLAVRKTKEVGIRKVLGASVSSIVILLSKTFMSLVGIAFLIACPVSYWLMKQWQAQFAYQTDIGIGIFLMSVILSAAVAIGSVSYRAIRVASSNPVDALRDE